MALIAQHDGHAGVQEREFAQPAFQQRVVEFGLGEGARAGLERHLGAAAAIGGADDFQRSVRLAVLEADAVLLAVAPDADLHPFRQRVHHRGADAVQAAGHLVGVLVELAAGVQAGQHDLGRGDAFLDVHVGRNASAIIAHGDAAVAVQGQFDVGGEPGLDLVHRVVDDLERHVMQAGTVIGVPDIHARSAAHGIEAFEDRNRGGVIRIGVRIGGRRGVVRHAGERLHTVGWCTLDI